MSRQTRENILPTSGNQELFGKEGGVSIFTKKGKRTFINVRPGQLVVFDPATLLTVPQGATPLGLPQLPGGGSAATVSLTAVAPRVVIAIGCDTNGNGLTDTLRKCFGDVLYGCQIQAATAEAPACGQPGVVDLLFDCTKCEEDYTIKITVEDGVTQGHFPFNRPSDYTFTYRTDCCGCDDCSSDHNCSELACGFIKQINDSGYRSDYGVYGKEAVSPELPFYAVRLFENSCKYTFGTPTDECNDCVDVDTVIGGVDVDGTVTTFDLPVASDQAANKGLLPLIAASIEEALETVGGSATFTRGTGVCCDFTLEINSCATVTLLDIKGAPIAATECTNPFEPIDQDNDCPTCDDVAPKTYNCGIRIISKPIELDCNCYPANPKIGFKGRIVKLFATDGFECNSTHVQYVQEPELPENLGYDWQWRDLMSDNGGAGRSHNGHYNDPHGPLGLPLPGDRINSSKVDCSKGYCSYALHHRLVDMAVHATGSQYASRGRTIVLIPEGDDVTRQDWEDFINPYITAGCCPVQSITCSYDQDQVEDATGDPATGLGGDGGPYGDSVPYPNANGQDV